MRTSAAVVGGLGAALGAFFYPSAVVLWAAIKTIAGVPLSPTDDVDLAFAGPLAAAALCCVAGGAGAWLVFAGGRARNGPRHGTRRGALLMLLAALGVAAFVAAQPFLVDAAGDRGLPERFRDDTEPSLGGSAVGLVPAGMLLAGAALAFSAPNRAEE